MENLCAEFIGNRVEDIGLGVVGYCSAVCIDDSERVDLLVERLLADGGSVMSRVPLERARKIADGGVPPWQPCLPPAGDLASQLVTIAERIVDLEVAEARSVILKARAKSPIVGRLIAALKDLELAAA